uniref:Uncharacterized protein n=1 Tax=Tanacetum cinerariifolium TaxID=118510 RepID=A0A699GRW7_TANCI|nr:hypothetical protein [Tanacetum cinerariifolium]
MILEKVNNNVGELIGIGVSTDSEDTMNDDSPIGGASAVREGVTPSVVDMTVDMGKQNSLDDTTIPGSFPPLSTSVSTTAGNTPGKSSYVNITGNNNPLIQKKWDPDENLLKEDVSTVLVWVKLQGVPVTAFSEDGLSAIATKLDNILVAMPKITREGHYTCNVRVEYWWKPPSDNKKKGVEPTIEVSNSNPFKVLNSVDNDREFGTNGGTNNLVNNEATSSGSSFMNIDNDGEFSSNTPICAKIKKMKRQIGEGKLRLLDNDGNPLVSMGIVESDSVVEVVFDETAKLRIPTSGKDGSDKGYGTNSLLEQQRDDYDPYDDDMYENHDLSEHLLSICDDLDVAVRGRKKK